MVHNTTPAPHSSNVVEAIATQALKAEYGVQVRTQLNGHRVVEFMPSEGERKQLDLLAELYG
jgi:hypothetical protein